MRNKLNNHGETNRVLLFVTILISAIAITFNITSIILKNKDNKNDNYKVIRVYSDGTLIAEHAGVIEILNDNRDKITFAKNGVEYTYSNCTVEILK